MMPQTGGKFVKSSSAKLNLVYSLQKEILNHVKDPFRAFLSIDLLTLIVKGCGVKTETFDHGDSFE